MKKQHERIVLFEDEAALTLEPLSLTRPVWKLRCGLRTLEQKILHHFPEADVLQFARPYLQPAKADPAPDGDTLWINGSLIPGKDFAAIKELKLNSAMMLNDRVVAFRGSPPKNWIGGTKLSVKGFDIIEASDDLCQLITYPWHLVSAVGSEVTKEARELRDLGRCLGDVHDRTILIHKQDIFIAESCKIEPGVVMNAEAGPIVLDDGVLIGANAVIEGPTYLGPGTQVKPLTHIRASCFGEECRAGGEISVSIMQGFSNKGHGGFLGHSFLGEWCNLGSGTETSNLKNNYSPVKVQIGNQLIDTGELFVGLTMGDHSKSAIGTVFNTGTVVGVGCILFGTGFPPRHIPSFHWGGSEKLTRYRLKPTIETAGEVMKRRHKELSQVDKDILSWIYSNKTSL